MGYRLYMFMCLLFVCQVTLKTDATTTEDMTTMESTTDDLTTMDETTEKSTTASTTDGATTSAMTSEMDASTTSGTTRAMTSGLTTDMTERTADSTSSSGVTETMADSSTAGTATTDSSTQSDATTSDQTQGSTTEGPTEIDTTEDESTTEPVMTTIAGSDLSVTDLIVTEPNPLTVILDTDTFVTYSINITNSGGVDVVTSRDDWIFEIVLSSSNNPTSDSAKTEMYPLTWPNSVNTSFEITANDTITLTGLQSRIIIETNNPDCYEYKYTCVKISTSDSANNIDDNSDNNHHCVMLGDVDDGHSGTVVCGGCVAQVSLVLLSVACLINRFIY